MDEYTSQSVWQLYEKGKRYHDNIMLKDTVLKCYRFYEGDQWYGLESADENLPCYNFITPTIKYKTAMIAMNNMSITYSAQHIENQAIIDNINKFAAQKWEKLKMDSVCWDIVRAAAIAGDAYIYFYSDSLDCQVIDSTNVFLADERQPDLQKQRYIIIYERQDCDILKKIAIKNGLEPQKADEIVPDNDISQIVSTETQLEVNGDNKCSSLLFLQVKDGSLYFMRTTKNVVYQPLTKVEGLDMYPIASLIFGKKKGSARGLGEVLPLIPNQIEVNRNLVRRIINSKLTAFSRLVYSSDSVVNPGMLNEVGTALEIDTGGVSSINDKITYLSAAPMSSDAKNLTDELLNYSKELAGAGDAALGNIDPTKASGTAIIATRDQAALPLNDETASFRQFIEDVALIWFKMWSVYGFSDGLDTIVDYTQLKGINPYVRVDISSTNPFSKFARGQSVEKLFTMGAITFEEYVNLLEDDASVPKTQLLELLKNRARDAYLQFLQDGAGMAAQNGGSVSALAPNMSGGVVPVDSLSNGGADFSADTSSEQFEKQILGIDLLNQNLQ